MVEPAEIEITVRFAERADTPALHAIELASFRDPWSKRSLEQDSCLVAVSDGTVVGFLIWREVYAGDKKSPAEREILNVAVAPEWRRRGVAKALLTQALSEPAMYFLEVRESNAGARQLYEHSGFVEVGRRPKYYRRPVETAIVMKMKRC